MGIGLVGNDVCNKFVDDTVDHMTTPQQMYNNLVKTLTFLNDTLPAGSHVFMTGVADGRYLYSYLSKRMHPLGSLNQDVTYPALYTFLNCLAISPCSGWMNTNETVRNATARRVFELNNAIVDVQKDFSKKFRQFDVSYFPNPVDDGTCWCVRARTCVLFGSVHLLVLILLFLRNRRIVRLSCEYCTEAGVLSAVG